MILLPKYSGDGGYILIVRPEGSPIEQETLQCVHCMKHWSVIPGSGKHRGFCTKCMGPLCGAEKCMRECVPFMKKVEGEAKW